MEPPQNLWPLGARERFMRPEGFWGTVLCGILQVAPWDHTSPLTVIAGASAKRDQELQPSHWAVCAPPWLCFDFLNCWPHLLGKHAEFCTAMLMFASPRRMAGCISSLPGIRNSNQSGSTCSVMLIDHKVFICTSNLTLLLGWVFPSENDTGCPCAHFLSSAVSQDTPASCPRAPLQAWGPFLALAREGKPMERQKLQIPCWGFEL